MLYTSRSAVAAILLMPFVANGGRCQETADTAQVPVHLQVESGVPLRLYVTRRVHYKVGEQVEGKLIEPVWAFDRVAIPAGSTLQGEVVRLDPVPTIVRARAILGGDFTPLKRARVSFTKLTLPDERVLSIRTDDSLGLGTIYVEPKPPKKPKKQSTSPAKRNAVYDFLRQQARSQVEAQANARSRGIYDLVRGPNKREWVENFLLSKLPYHPQWYRSRTRFDAVLTSPIDFGNVQVPSDELAQGLTPAPGDRVAQMRLLTSMSSGNASVGDPVQGVLSQPLFTPKHELLLPEGTRFDGKITLTQRARLFHRGGKLRFVIENVALPQTADAAYNNRAGERANHSLNGQLAAVEANPNVIKVDAEGTATASDSKTRLLRPVIAGLIAAKSLDNDAGRQTASGGAAAPNNGGRGLAGFSGFGLLGTLAARGPHPIGAALGFYGLAWSVYSNILARGSEVVFPKNTAIAIQFGNARSK